MRHPCIQLEPTLYNSFWQYDDSLAVIGSDSVWPILAVVSANCCCCCCCVFCWTDWLDLLFCRFYVLFSSFFKLEWKIDYSGAILWLWKKQERKLNWILFSQCSGHIVHKYIHMYDGRPASWGWLTGVRSYVRWFDNKRWLINRFPFSFLFLRDAQKQNFLIIQNIDYNAQWGWWWGEGLEWWGCPGNLVQWISTMTRTTTTKKKQWWENIFCRDTFQMNGHKSNQTKSHKGEEGHQIILIFPECKWSMTH